MVPVPFFLLPFPGEPAPPGLAVSGEASRRGETLSLRYRVDFGAAPLDVPPSDPAPGRRDRLWESTCLEAFVAAAGLPGYLELNLSPAGHWNAWRFDGYRAGMREAAGFARLPFRAACAPGRLDLEADVPLGRALPPGRPWEVGASAVLRAAGGATTHWALAHPGPRPDFHLRAAFRIVLPG